MKSRFSPWASAARSVLFGIALFTGACASTSVTPTGSARYAALSQSEPVVVYQSDSQVGQPFEVVGTIDHVDPGKYDILTLGDAIPALKKKARDIGGNGIIIDQVQRVASGIVSRGIAVQARAIRVLGAGAPTPTPS